jgi:hypothetical protein
MSEDEILLWLAGSVMVIVGCVAVTLGMWP